MEFIILILLSLCSVVSSNSESNPFSVISLRTDSFLDLRRCRVSHSGLEYDGTVSETKSGLICQNWETPNPVHKTKSRFTDLDFPEGSKRKAKNFCRNPRHWSGRPWCYTLDLNVTEEDCNIPLCVKRECRLTGIGAEYAGYTFAADSKPCLYWSDVTSNQYKQVQYDSLFPDRTRKGAENHCRNPDGDIGGPWCFVAPESQPSEEENKSVVKAYCGIPFCHPKPCMVATVNVGSHYNKYHSVFSLIPFDLTTIEFSARLWNPEEWKDGELRIALSSVPIPSTGSYMRTQKIGIEIVISNYKSGITPGDDEKPDWYIEPKLLSGTHWRDLELAWTNNFISLKIKGKSLYIFSKDFSGKGENLANEKLKYYSIQATNALWSFPFCSDQFPYEEHITTHGDFDRRWPLPKTNLGLELRFFVRGFHTAILELKAAAMLQYPSIQLTFINSKMDNLTTLTVKEDSTTERSLLKVTDFNVSLTYWEWEEFVLHVDGPSLELTWVKDSRSVSMLHVTFPTIKSCKWYSIGSRQSTVHWAIGGYPPPHKRKLPAELPECMMEKGTGDFKGYQSVTATGLTCVPWNDHSVSSKFRDNDFVDGSKKKAKNYCRNPSRSVEGPFCYARKLSDYGPVVVQENCSPRQCRSKECKMGGTGNDYIGTLNITSSGRICQGWTVKKPHYIPQKLLNKELFPELSLDRVDNFCRNPSHGISGPWCYTTSTNVEVDRCSVPDCDVADECTVIVTGGNVVRQNVYILPLWKTIGLEFKVKNWDPRWNEGLSIILSLSSKSVYYRLVIGGDDNNNVILHYVHPLYGEKLLKTKTVAHIIPAGSWAAFVLVIGFGEISLRHSSVPNAFFKWKSTYSAEISPIQVKYLSYSTLSGNHSIALNFPCKECHTHITPAGIVSIVYPLNWWKTQTSNPKVTELKLNIFGSGAFVVMFIRMIEIRSTFLAVEIDGHGRVMIKDASSVLAYSNRTLKFTNSSAWTSLNFLITEKQISLKSGETPIIKYQSRSPLIFYFFTFSVSQDTVTWSANCEPPDITAKPINGGWSDWGPWRCSVTCGGGHGRRRRDCTNPTPNLFGEPCSGVNEEEGECNVFKCGDVPPDFYKEITNSITKEAHNIRKTVGDHLVVKCDSLILEKLKDVSPSTKVEWTKDGVPQVLQEKIGIIDIDKFKIEKESVTLNDSGIYICSLEAKKNKAVIKLIAVTVVTDTYTMFVREGYNFVLDCRATSLTYVFNGLTQFWAFNKTLFENHGATSYSLLDVDILGAVKSDHQGEWECVVVQAQYNLTWVTTWFRLKVKEGSAFAFMFDTLFIGNYFTLFGKHSKWNSFFFLLFLLPVICTISFMIMNYKRMGKSIINIIKEKLGKYALRIMTKIQEPANEGGEDLLGQPQRTSKVSASNNEYVQFKDNTVYTQSPTKKPVIKKKLNQRGSGSASVAFEAKNQQRKVSDTVKSQERRGQQRKMLEPGRRQHPADLSAQVHQSR